MQRLLRTPLILIALLGVLVLLMAACGGGDNQGISEEEAQRIAQEAAAAAAASAPQGLSEEDVARIAAEAAQAASGPSGITAAQMSAAITEAMGQLPPGVTAEDVAMIAEDAARQAASGGVSTADVQAAITMALEEALTEPEPFRIGVMESLTGPGETYGNVAVQAKQMAVDQINAAGGVNGRMVELIVEDSKCSAADAIIAYNKLTSVDGVKIILGTSCSGAMLGAAPRAEEDGVVMFSGLATNPDIADAGDYIFRTALNDLQLGIDTGNLMWADGIRTLATINESTDYAEGVRRTSVAQFEKLGGEVVAAESYASDIIDFRSQLTKLFGENPDALHIAAQAESSGGTVVKQARELGYEGPIYSEIVPVGATALEIAGEAATGLKAIITELDPNNTKARQLLVDFRNRYEYVTLPWYIGSAYDDVYITAECLKKTGDDQDADGFRDCLYGITWRGTIGDEYSFDERGEVVGLANVVVEVLPVAERTPDNQGYRVLGPAPSN